LEELISLDNLKAISRDNHGFIREILEVYLSSTPKDLLKLQTHVVEENWEMVRYFAHKMKSSSFTIGFIEGFKIFQKMENTIKDNEDLTGIHEVMQQASTLCDNAHVQVKIELSNYL
jgi:HPt (histidine-containing phosphotransfer) domain-containing protein